MIAALALRETASDPMSALVAAVTDQLAPAIVIIEKSHTTPWESATFSGARHEIALTIRGADALPRAHAFVAQLPDCDFDLGDQILVDIVVPQYEIDGPVVHMTVECLSVEAA
jgi:hypothetical protein